MSGPYSDEEVIELVEDELVALEGERGVAFSDDEIRLIASYAVQMPDEHGVPAVRDAFDLLEAARENGESVSVREAADLYDFSDRHERRAYMAARMAEEAGPPAEEEYTEDEREARIHQMAAIMQEASGEEDS